MTLEEKLTCLSYGYLETLGIFTSADYINVQYVVQKKINLMETITSGIMMYILAKELFSIKIARYAALVAAISPFAIQYSQEARMYAMLVFFILIAAYFFVKGLRTNKTRYFLLWGLLRRCLSLSMLMPPTACG